MGEPENLPAPSGGTQGHPPRGDARSPDSRDAGRVLSPHSARRAEGRGDLTEEELTAQEATIHGS